jgi:hypothetical protein
MNSKSEKCLVESKEYSIFFDNMTYLPCTPSHSQYPQYGTICSIAHGALPPRNTAPTPLSFGLRNVTFINCLNFFKKKSDFFDQKFWAVLG